MLSLSLTSPSILVYLSLAAIAVVFLIRYAPAPLAKAFERTVESRISERMRELEAQREHQSKMLTDLSHNLQTPLAVLRAKAERYERTLLHDGQAGPLCQSIDTVSHFINEVLALSNLERSIREEEWRTFSLSELVRDAVEDASVLADAEGIGLTSDLTPDISIFGNERRLSDAVMNLLGNAVKYMGSGPVQLIRVSLKQQHNRIVLQVTDTGMGIPEQELPHIFERFYRGSARTYENIPGTGLGLAFVERIVNEHDGAITARSEVGKGSTFILTLPGLRRAHSRTSPA